MILILWIHTGDVVTRFRRGIDRDELGIYTCILADGGFDNISILGGEDDPSILVEEVTYIVLIIGDRVNLILDEMVELRQCPCMLILPRA
jgi:hypothetical protein